MSHVACCTAVRCTPAPWEGKAARTRSDAEATAIWNSTPVRLFGWCGRSSVAYHSTQLELRPHHSHLYFLDRLGRPLIYFQAT